MTTYAYLVRDDLGDYLVAICDHCGRTVPLPPGIQHLDPVNVPPHQCRPRRNL